MEFTCTQLLGAGKRRASFGNEYTYQAVMCAELSITIATNTTSIGILKCTQYEW